MSEEGEATSTVSLAILYKGPVPGIRFLKGAILVCLAGLKGEGELSRDVSSRNAGMGQSRLEPGREMSKS